MKADCVSRWGGGLLGQLKYLAVCLIRGQVLNYQFQYPSVFSNWRSGATLALALPVSVSNWGAGALLAVTIPVSVSSWRSGVTPAVTIPI